MDEATQDQHEVHSVTEPKKRGRKPKSIVERAGNFAEPPKDGVEEHMRDVVISIEASCLGVSHAQALASRIFAGQSPDLPMSDRLARVRAGLEAQGLSMDGVEL